MLVRQLGGSGGSTASAEGIVGKTCGGIVGKRSLPERTDSNGTPA